MRVSIITLFPEMVQSVLQWSIVGRTQKRGLLAVDYIDIRDFAIDAYGTVDDRPYGGGVGMLLRVDVVHNALLSVLSPGALVVLTHAGGQQFSQQLAQQYVVNYKHIIILCGHYEGIDDRIRTFAHTEVSIGPYVLTGGELPACVITDAICRLIPGALSKSAIEEETHTTYQKEYPQYTRPQIYKGHSVPAVLLNGNHLAISQWRQTNSKMLPATVCTTTSRTTTPKTTEATS